MALFQLVGFLGLIILDLITFDW